MPESKAQIRYMQGILHGMKPKGGKKAPPKKVAKEIVSKAKGSKSYANLPEHKSK